MKLLKEIMDTIRKPDTNWAYQAVLRLDRLTKPQGSLGVLEELAATIVSIKANLSPDLDRKVIFTLAGDHGIAAAGVSAYPQEVTRQMVLNFLNQGAAINVLARQMGATIIVADLGVAAEFPDHPDLMKMKVAKGTRNFAIEPAMSREQAIQSVENGIRLFQQAYSRGIDIAAVGEMGIGNTTSASAITACLTESTAAEVTGRGTGISDDSYQRKIELIDRALHLHAPEKGDGLGVLSAVGGFEIGGMAGVILAAAANHIPVVLDGFICGAAALIAAAIKPEVKPYLIASHCSVEKGHRILLSNLGLKPILNLDLRLGEGTGAALSLPIIEAAVRLLTEMATFSEAGVSEKET